jgi:hypothetical protein
MQFQSIHFQHPNVWIVQQEVAQQEDRFFGNTI